MMVQRVLRVSLLVALLSVGIAALATSVSPTAADEESMTLAEAAALDAQPRPRVACRFDERGRVTACTLATTR
jgi:hypothetical protein